ncbi:MAG: hypothetical protein K2M78_12050 [Lachnospiraceae bacterium]|nr:hypothetical protein [Lachnospiraceae bacterium]
MLYSLFAPMWRTNDVLRKLLKEVLGYNDDEIKILESERFGRNIVKNLTIEQAKEITEIFLDNDFLIYLNDGRGSDGVIPWKELGIFPEKHQPKDHYCDEPLLSREYLDDLSIPKKIDPPIKEILFDKKTMVECPYCHSANTKKISTTSKVANTALFGVFGTKRFKQWHCNNCSSDF